MSSVRKTIIETLGITGIALAVGWILVALFIRPFPADSDRSYAKATGEKDGLDEVPNRPIVIWYQDPWRDPNVVRLVLNNNIFSHVMLVGLHKFDSPNYYKKPFVKETIRLCKEKGVKVIWTRWLYPGYRFEKFKNQDAFEAMYYVQQIRLLRQEARLLGVDLVAFDAEPNANATMKSLKRRKLPRDEFEKMRNAVKTAVAVEGQVDFILPAGQRTYLQHMYNAARYLGKHVIAEFTYYDLPGKIKNTKIPYDIFGAYVSVTKENKNHPHLPYFTASEILERQDLWAHKRGLFIYPGYPRKDADAVALEFSKITSIHPVRDSNRVR